MGTNDNKLNKEQKRTKQNEVKTEKIVREILDKCKKKNIRVDYILKVNSWFYNIDGMEYFIAPPIKDVGGINFGCRHGYSYNSKSIFKRLKKASLGSGDFIWDDVECVYRAEDLNEDA